MSNAKNQYQVVDVKFYNTLLVDNYILRMTSRNAFRRVQNDVKYLLTGCNFIFRRRNRPMRVMTGTSCIRLLPVDVILISLWNILYLIIACLCNSNKDAIVIILKIHLF